MCLNLSYVHVLSTRINSLQWRGIIISCIMIISYHICIIFPVVAVMLQISYSTCLQPSPADSR